MGIMKVWDGGAWNSISKSAIVQKPIGMTIVVPTGYIGVGTKVVFTVPTTRTLRTWYIDSLDTGSCVIDVWVKSGSNPTVADTICGGGKPTLTSAKNASGSTLNGVIIPAESKVIFNIDSLSALQQLTLIINAEE